MVDDNEIKKRAEKYIQGMKDRLSKVSFSDNSMKKVYDLAFQYTEDAEYYLKSGDYSTALVDIAYAEGLLDALLILNNIDPDSQIAKKVFVGGTFDILHPGHIAFLREASKLGRVYVSVARDINSEKIKGRKPINDENHRLEVIKSVRYVYDAFLGDEKDFLKSVERVKPDIIFLGPDQKVDEDQLRRELEKRNLKPEIIRLKERIKIWNHSSTTDIIKEVVNRYCKDQNLKS
ncbi:MAG: cytidylyltransferase family protein [Sulfolobaceae archaeon]|nr:cytidylyltransferase family protein [Sulfolobaceae archaeon]